MSEESIYDFRATDIRGQEHSLDEFRGKVLLIVNTASKCGFTPQFEGLQGLYAELKDRGLEVLGFPCNQFNNQDPADDQAIALPWASEMVTMVLLKLAFTWAMPDEIFLRSRLRRRPWVAFAMSSRIRRCRCRRVRRAARARFAACGFYFLPPFFFPAIALAGPLRVRALVCVRWPLTGSPLRCRRPR